jgi:hypothetical protein
MSYLFAIVLCSGSTTNLGAGVELSAAPLDCGAISRDPTTLQSAMTYSGQCR